MFGSEIWDKLPKSIFENAEIARVKHFKIFKNYKGDSPKNCSNQTWLNVNHTKSTLWIETNIF